MVLSEKLFMKAHLTYQKSTVSNFQDASRDQVAGKQGKAIEREMTADIMDPDIIPKPIYSSDAQIDPKDFKDDVDNEAIPSFWGSLSITYKPIKKLSINAQGYYYDKYYLYTQYANDKNRAALITSGEKDKMDYTGHIDGKFILNAKANYKLSDNINLYVNGRNILNNDKQEYIFMDTIGGLYLAGFNINF